MITKGMGLQLDAMDFTAEGEPTDPPPVRFLNRFDKSATNIKETLLWGGIGQVRFLHVSC